LEFGGTLSSNVDLLIYDRENRLAVTVDIRARRGTSREWAAQLRRNLLQHEGFRGARFFLVVALDQIYLWPQTDATPDLFPPAYEIEAETVFKPYLVGTRLDLQAVDGMTFELLVSSWLSALVYSRGAAPSGQVWLEESGFLEAVRNGRLYDQAAA
jgi:hypothetical protein